MIFASSRRRERRNRAQPLHRRRQWMNSIVTMTKNSFQTRTYLFHPGSVPRAKPILHRTWSFKGPDNLSYKWISLASCPVLIHDTQPIPTPIARYRPAKLGIISRSRRGFLEILPGGLEKEDWIVVTFAGYFRMKLGGNIPLTPTPRIRHDISSPLLTAPMGVMGVGVGVIRGPMSVSEPTTPIRAPRNLSPLKSPCSPSPLTYLEALRRKGKDYDLARRNC